LPAGLPSPPLNTFTFLPISEFHTPPASAWRAQECKPLHVFSKTIAILSSDPRSSASISGKLLLFQSGLCSTAVPYYSV